MFTRFREHRGQFDESMRTTVRLNTYNELLAHVRGIMAPWYVPVPVLKITPYYGVDPRNGWDDHIVTLEGYGVVGFTDGAVDDVPE